MSRNRKAYLLVFILMIAAGFRMADEYFEISRNLEIFGTVYKTLHTDYVDELKPGEMMKTGIDAMLNSLDPYTNYFTESQAEDAMIRQSGEYGGIGCNSSKIGDFICITNIMKGMPADKAGLRIGDKILEINGRSFTGKSVDEVGEVLKGAPGTKLSITVDRQGNKQTLQVTREEVKIKNVTWFGMADSKTGYIRLDHFMIGAGQEVRDALVKLKESGAEKLILDLRDNGGGLLHEAVRIVNIFIPANQLVVVSKGRSRDAYLEYKTMDGPLDLKIPLVVLVNERSASASEIVSGAIQDLDRGLVVGRNTFGKGLVQSVRPLVYRTQMKLTIAKYYIPSGRCIQELDYSHRSPDGKVIPVPDSLRKTFKTKNGRPVLDGGGVRPDVLVPAREKSAVEHALLKSHLIFEFAGLFREGTPDIPEPQKFIVDENIFASFLSFAEKNASQLQTESEKSLQVLQEKMKTELTGFSATEEIEKLSQTIRQNKIKALQLNQSELSKLLRTEICKRYYYEDGYFLTAFVQDDEILECMKLLSDQERYKQLLGNR